MNRIKSISRAALVFGVSIAAAVMLFSSASNGGEREIKNKKGGSQTKVKATVTSRRANAGQRVITIKLAIDKGWKIYANPVNNATFASNATKVIIKAGGRKAPARVIFPKGRLEVDFGEKMNVYRNAATIYAIVPAAVIGPLELCIQVNACDKKTCLDTGCLRFLVR